jgi:hypothetical protein
MCQCSTTTNLSASRPFAIREVVATLRSECSARSSANMNASRVSLEQIRMPFITTCCLCTDRRVRAAESRCVLRRRRCVGRVWLRLPGRPTGERSRTSTHLSGLRVNQGCGFAGCRQPQAIAITSRKPTAPYARASAVTARLLRRLRWHSKPCIQLRYAAHGEA